MADDSISEWAVLHDRVTCRMCAEPVIVHYTEWTAERGNVARVTCEKCGLEEWRPVRARKQRT